LRHTCAELLTLRQPPPHPTPGPSSQLKVPETDNLLVSRYWSNARCIWATIDTDTIDGRLQGSMPGAPACAGGGVQQRCAAGGK
jgi:hypothetical protein